MPPLQLDDNRATYQVRSYQPGIIQINEAIYTRSIIIAPNQLIDDWSPTHIEDLTANDFDHIANLHPDVVLVGTGMKQAFLPAALYGQLLSRGIGVEIMNTSAACRTYNALSSENRNVVAALFL